MPKIKLLSIEEEAAACRKAWEGYGLGTLAHCLHHAEHFEILTQPVKYRIKYILSAKPPYEQALRLRLLRPVAPDQRLNTVLAAWLNAYEKWQEMVRVSEQPEPWQWQCIRLANSSIELGNDLHAKLFPKCPWDGHTIFAKGWDETDAQN